MFNKLLAPLALLFAGILAAHVHAEPSALPPLTNESGIAGLTNATAPTYTAMLDSARRGNTVEAVALADKLVTQFTEIHGEGKLLIMPMLHLGIAHLRNNDAASAMAVFGQTVEFTEATHGEYDSTLVAPLQGLSLSHVELGNLPEAESTLRRAQHITHRNGGVYSTDQLAIIDQLIFLIRRNGGAPAVDRQQKFYLKIYEEVYGESDPRILPALDRYGRYMATRALGHSAG